MFGRDRKRSQGRHTVAGAGVEVLESRRLLSSAPAVTMSPGIVFNPAASGSSSIQGYDPSQIRKAYGFDQVSGDGSGQTIAIVDAYNDPNIQNDLNVFDGQFGLSSANLKVVNQSGGSALPTTDSGWAGEIALDVEWAHAIAPSAKILLVEANSSSLSDLIGAVNYARHASGVSVVSMSWGGSEFFSWSGGEFTGETQYDSTFTTPGGHQGVTFVAAAGDSGAASGVQWPAISPNVISVGGTSLYTSDSTGTYAGESAWSGTSGGFSQVEVEPNYQQDAQSTGVRTAPDVSYNGDPNTGFAIYDSVPDQGSSGWEEVGGTSAGAPQWAALIAIADQARVSAGRSTLDGASQTLPILYSLYASSDGSIASSYATSFNDVTTGGGGSWHWRWGGYGSGGVASAGYDTATGLGTPQAGQIINALSGSTSNPGNNGPGNGNASNLAASPVSAAVVGSVPASALAGQSGSLKIRLTNTAGSRFAGPVSITLYASSDSSLSNDDTFVTTVSLSNVKLGVNGSKTVRVKFDYPDTLPDGSYYMVASVSAVGLNTATADAAIASPVTIAAPTVDLSTAFVNPLPVRVTPGKGANAAVRITNTGNVNATGVVDLSLYASTTLALDGTEQLLTTLPTRRINLKPGRSITLHVHFQAPTDQTGGTYSLLATTSSSTSVADTNSGNDLASIDTQPA